MRAWHHTLWLLLFYCMAARARLPECNLETDPQLKPPPPPLARIHALATEYEVTLKVEALGAGAPLYATVLAFDAKTGLIAWDGTTAPAEGTVKAKLPAGEFKFYMRSFGYVPVEVGPISVPATTSFTGQINTTLPTTESPLIPTARFEPFAIFAGAADSSTIEVRAASNLGSSIHVYNEFGNFTLNGERVASIELFDNGALGDNVAGDFVYTRRGIRHGREDLVAVNRIESATLLYARTAQGMLRLPTSTLISVHRDLDEAPRHIHSRVQHTRFAVNIVRPLTGEPSSTLQDAAREFYKEFPDDYDFLLVTSPRSTFSGGLYYGVRNSVKGIGRSEFDYGSDYGSRERLQGAVWFSIDERPPLLHELNHRWGNFMTDLFPPGCGSHWGYAGVHGPLGGFDPNSLAMRAAGVYSVSSLAECGWADDNFAYSPLDLYLMGLAAWPANYRVPVLLNPIPSTVHSGAYAVSSLRYVTGEDVVAKYGVRTPSPAQAQRDFKSAFILVTDTPANAASLAYISALAQNLSGAMKPPGRLLSFGDATAGLASMDTRVRPLIAAAGPSLVVRAENTPVRLEWAESGTSALQFSKTNHLGWSLESIDRAGRPAAIPSTFNNSAIVPPSSGSGSFRMKQTPTLNINVDLNFTYLRQRPSISTSFGIPAPLGIAPQETLRNEPLNLGGIRRYGALRLGNGADPDFAVITEVLGDQTTFWIDTDNDEDFSDEIGGASRNIELTFEVINGAGNSANRKVYLWCFIQSSGNFGYYSVSLYRSILTVEGGSVAATIFERGPIHNGTLVEDGVWLDTNGNGALDDPAEHFKQGDSVTLFGKTYKIYLAHP